MFNAQENNGKLRAHELRESAEARLHKPKQVGTGTDLEVQKLLHELQVHQIELELQNDELRRSERTYQALYERYVELYDSSPSGYVILDADQFVTEANSTILGMLQVSRTDITTRRFEQYLESDDRALFCDSFEDLFQNDRVQSFSARLNELEPPIIVQIDMRPKMDSHGRVCACRISLTDITELETAKLKLEEALGDLRHTQDQLVQQEKLAVVGQLAAGVAHDMNNSLTSILIFAELLESADGMPEELRAHASKIVNATRHATSSVRQILDFAQNSPSNKTVVDLSESVRQIVQFLSPLVPDNVRFEPCIACEEFVTFADASQLQQIVANLVVNSRDAMPRGGRISLGLRAGKLPTDVVPTPADNDFEKEWLCLSVRDNGHGIPPEILPHIFEPFFTTKATGKGSGLGLSQVFGLTAQNGGYLSVVSRPGATEFRVFLPKATEVPKTPAPTSHGSAKKGVTGEGTVLVVDDEPAIRDAIEFLLQALEYKVLVACNGSQALEVFESTSEEITHLLCDVNMPGMSGTEVAGTLLARDNAPRIVLMSGNPLNPDAANLLAEIKWIPKPISVHSLARALGAGEPSEKQAASDGLGIPQPAQLVD